MKTPIDPNKEYAFIGKTDENGNPILKNGIPDIDPYFVLGKDLTEAQKKAIEEHEERESKK